MSTIQAAKKLLRSEVKKRLLAMPREQILEESNKLTCKLLSHPSYMSSRRIAVFLSMDDEVQTQGVLQSIFSLGKICYIPRYDVTSTHMDMLRLHSMQDIETLPLTKWNVRQPDASDSRENAMESGGLDLVIVPGLAFTLDGHRMGRGKGYYDSFLHRCQQSQKTPLHTIAMALSPQLVPNLPTHDHDILIDTIITL